MSRAYDPDEEYRRQVKAEFSNMESRLAREDLRRPIDQLAGYIGYFIGLIVLLAAAILFATVFLHIPIPFVGM